MAPVYNQAATAYHALHPNVTVTVSPFELRTSEEKMAVAIPSNTGPDIADSQVAILSAMIEKGLMAKMPDWLQQFAASSAYDKFTISSTSYNGVLWGLPEDIGTNALFYNKDMFAAAGLQPPASMADIVADASKLAVRGPNGQLTVSGLSLRLTGGGSGLGQKWWVWEEQCGHGLVAQNAAGKWHADYANDCGVSTLEMYVNMVNKSPIVDDPNIAADTAAFETQKTAMFVRESNVIADIAKNAPTLVGHYGVVPLPVATRADAESLFVTQSSPHQQTAWDFIRFLADETQQAAVAAIAGWKPARADADYSQLMQQQPAWTAFLQPQASLKSFATPTIA